MNKSDQINELALALSKAQSEIEPAKKDAANPFFKSKYADLSSVWAAAQKPLNKNGLSIVQTTKVVDHKLMLETVLMHSSGQWISGEFPIRPTKDDPQALGSATSYARRYALAAMLSITQDDDDAESNMTRENTHAPKTFTRTTGK